MKKFLRFMAAFLMMIFAVRTFAAVSEQEVVSTIKAANDGEIEMGKIAKSRAQSKLVKDFAQQMIDEHSDSNKKAIALRAQLKATDNFDRVKDLRKENRDKMADLRKAKPQDFDKTYMKEQVKIHQNLLKEIDDKLLPAATSENVKEYADATRKDVAEHLDKADQVEKSLEQAK